MLSLCGSIHGFVYRDMAVHSLGLDLLRSLALSVVGLVDSAQILFAPHPPGTPSSLKTPLLGGQAPYLYSSFSLTGSTARATCQTRNQWLTREREVFSEGKADTASHFIINIAIVFVLPSRQGAIFFPSWWLAVLRAVSVPVSTLRRVIARVGWWTRRAR
ncbi:hypothetical protein MVEN_01610100 [Mycena venus]|uniref:Uncharacterized protein n=1 Tax=Mycena venus TaxID=2733690 RepID=A0A8H7CRV4_9AGAR|nr:hypothetical protein MVEN_01610100 [Mycena venus]